MYCMMGMRYCMMGMRQGHEVLYDGHERKCKSKFCMKVKICPKIDKF